MVEGQWSRNRQPMQEAISPGVLIKMLPFSITSWREGVWTERPFFFE